MKKFISIFVVCSMLFMTVISCKTTGDFGKLKKNDYNWGFEGCTFSSIVAENFGQSSKQEGLYIVGSGHDEASANLDCRAQLANYLNATVSNIEMRKRNDGKKEDYKQATVLISEANTGRLEPRAQYKNKEKYYILSFISKEELDRNLENLKDCSVLAEEIISEWVNKNPL